MIAKGSGYVRSNRDAARARLISHFKYVEHRSRELSEESRDDRRVFDKEQDVVNRRDAVNDVMEHTSTSVNYHKIVLSPGEDEPVQDWRQWTRDVMQDLEEAQGRELHWYAVHHQNTDHPHIHVVVAGAGYNEETGREEPVKLYAKDYEMLRESGRDHSDYRFQHLLEEQFHELNTLDETIDRDVEMFSPERDPFHSPLEEVDR
jgi:type IV secretory pathway VirD2 relaxase